METIRKIGLLAFTALFLAMSSCNSDEGGEGVQTSDMASYIFATINGQSFKTFELNGFLSTTTTKNGTTITVAGMDSNQDVMTILLTSVTETGTYPISAENAGNRIGYGKHATNVNVDSTADCNGVSGSIVITALTDTKVEGTFTVTANNSGCNAQTAITSGSFRGTFPN